jgi:hypothetical protein
MKTILKRYALVYCHDGIYYCVEKTEENIKKYYNLEIIRDCEILKDVAVDEQYRIHSIDNKATLVFRSNDNIYYYWFQNGKNERENPEKIFIKKYHKNREGNFYYANRERVRLAEVIKNVKSALKK